MKLRTILKETYFSCVDEMLHGKWISTTNEISLSINKNNKEIIVNDTLSGTYYSPKQYHGTMWVWDKPQKDTHELIWKIDNKTGSLFFLDFVDNCETISLKGIPFYNKDSVIIFNKIQDYK